MTIAVLSNDHSWTYNLRRELIGLLLSGGHRVVLLLPYGEKVEALKEMGCEFFDVPYESHGTNPIREWQLYRTYKRLLSEIRPDLVLSYTIKPNVYGGLACRRLKLPYIVNVTGLGSSLHGGGALKKLVILLYKAGIAGARKVFFQNSADRDFMLSHSMVKGSYEVLPGSGVNTEHYSALEYPPADTTEFIFISRLLTEKGTEEFFTAASVIRGKYPQTRFHICGLSSEKYEKQLNDLIRDGIVCYHGAVSDIRPFLKETHCTVLPSYFEGMANALLESAASARPVIATDVPGCRETFREGVSGLSCRARSAASLIDAMEKFLALSYEEKKQMGLCGREWILEHFDRNKVLAAYQKEIEAFEKQRKQ